MSNVPDNRLKYPISQLIERLQKLPPGTTYEEYEPEFWGGQSTKESGAVLGTGYMLKIGIVEGYAHRPDESVT